MLSRYAPMPRLTLRGSVSLVNIAERHASAGQVIAQSALESQFHAPAVLKISFGGAVGTCVRMEQLELCSWVTSTFRPSV